MAAPSLFSSSGTQDLAAAWLGLLSGKDSIAAIGPQATLILAALKDALGLYGTAILVIGGLLLIYQVISLIAETAHTGQPFGRRGRMLWTPLRFVLALVLLVPIAGGLSTGQYLILKLAEQGSGLASTAWRSIAEPLRQLTAPQPIVLPPDTSRLVYGTVEMELCRAIYKLHRQELKDQPSYRLLGPMEEYSKRPQQRLVPETWLYSNNLQPDLPLCGSYQFARSSKPALTATESDSTRVSNDRIEFSRVSAERLSLQARVLAEQLAPLFFKSGVTVKLSAATNIASMQSDVRNSLSTKLKDVLPNDTAQLAARLTQATERGWIAAPTILPILSNSQWRYGQITQLGVAEVTPPLFGHVELTADRLLQDLVADPVLRDLPVTEVNRMQTLYAAMHQDMRQVRAWLYNAADDAAMLVPPDRMDLADLLARPGRADSGLLAGIIDSVALSHNLWNAAQPAGAAFSDFWVTSFNQNPLSVLTAFGQSLTQTANSLLELSGVILGHSGLWAHGVIFFAASTLLLCFGLCLLFLLPFVPLLRFAFGIVIWLLTLLEALIAMPLIALSLLSTSGDGLLSPAISRACWLWLGLFARPVLILLGFAIGLPLFAMALVMINLLLQGLSADFLFQWGDGLAYLRLGMICVYCLLVIGAFNLAFKGITAFPNVVLRWFGNLLSFEFHAPAHATAAQTATLPQTGAVTNATSYLGATTAKTVTAPTAQHSTILKERPVPPASETEPRIVGITPTPDSRAAERPADPTVTMTAGHVSLTAQTVAGHSDQILDDKGAQRASGSLAPVPDYANLAHAIKDLAERLDKTSPSQPEPDAPESKTSEETDETDHSETSKPPHPQPPK